jgi:hypothetical protein
VVPDADVSPPRAGHADAAATRGSSGEGACEEEETYNSDFVEESRGRGLSSSEAPTGNLPLAASSLQSQREEEDEQTYNSDFVEEESRGGGLSSSDALAGHLPLRVGSPKSLRQKEDGKYSDRELDEVESDED